MKTPSTVPTRPLLRYHGGKWQLAPWILEHFPEHRTYTEAYGGGGSVLLRKKRSYAEVYNDIDSEIVNLFRIARDRGDDLVRSMTLTPFSREEYLLSYEGSDDPLEQARRTIVRASMGIGSTGASGKNRTGFRSDVKRRGTHPAMDWAAASRSVLAVIERLQGVVIENRPALEVLQQHDGHGVLHYVDPPYLSETRTFHRGRGGGYKFDMSEADHRDLAQVLSGLKGAVVLSGYPSALYEELFQGWQRVERMTAVHGVASRGSTRTEVLWLKGCRVHPELF